MNSYLTETGVIGNKQTSKLINVCGAMFKYYFIFLLIKKQVTLPSKVYYPSYMFPKYQLPFDLLLIAVQQKLGSRI
jgi:hypothetical protein